MATSVESPSPASLHKASSSSISSSPQLFSPSSDKRFWSTLRGRVDTLLENRKPIDPSMSPAQMNPVAVDRGRRLKEDSMLLLRGFDSVAQSLSQLSNNLENALQGAKDLAKPPTLTEILYATIEKSKTEEKSSKEENKKDETEDEEYDNDADKRGLKRKLDSKECAEDRGEEDSNEAKEKVPSEFEKIKKAKNIAISMATKAATMARELKSIRLDLGFMQERCALLEEENRKLRDGLDKGIQPDEDDLVRLQLEALLAEKSRLANENANLKRENQCLNQLVEYHQLTSQDLSASYENLITEMGLDFSSPTENNDGEPFTTPKAADVFGFSKSLDKCFDEEE